MSISYNIPLVNANLRLPHRGRIFNFVWPLTRYLTTNLAALVSWVLFHVLNRTIVIGKGNVPTEPNTVLLPNHQSMIDGFLVGMAVYFPRSVLRPSLFPWLPAAYENFFAHPVLGWLSDNLGCIPVMPGRKDFVAMKRMERCLGEGILIVFPEGTRSRDGRLLPPRTGIGYVMLKTRPKAVPVCLDGMDRTLPVGRAFPRLRQTLFIYYGKPVDLSEFYGQPPTRESAQAAIERVFAEVRRMQRVLARYRRMRQLAASRLPLICRIYRA